MFQIERTIGSSHLSDGGVVTMGTIVDFMQDCCGFQLDSDVKLTNYFKENRVTMFLVSRQLNIHKRPVYGERISIGTFIYALKTAHGYRNTLIYNEEGDLLVSSYAVGAFVNMETARATTVPKEIREGVSMEPKFEDMEYLPRKIKLPDQGGVVCDTMPVYKHYIDENHHVNNARYFDIASEWLPEQFQIKASRIEYKTAAKAGEVIIPVRYDISPDTIIMSLTGTDGQVYTNIEFKG